MLTSKICMQLRVHDLLKKKGDRGVFSNKKGVFSVKQELPSHVMAVSFISGGNRSIIL